MTQITKEQIDRLDTLKDGLSFYYSEEKDALSALISLAESILPDGDCVVVPREPTKAMIMAGISERIDGEVKDAWKLATSNIYRAMLTASEV